MLNYLLGGHKVYIQGLVCKMECLQTKDNRRKNREEL